MTKRKALLIDVTLCVGCGACGDACREQNKLPEVTDELNKNILSDKNYTALEEHGEYFVRRMCQHCEDPSCVSVCPVGAFTKTKFGPVIYDESKCLGCRYCMQACPFQVPRYEWGSLTPRVRKCVMCYDRIKQGGTTACAEACPTGATIFGDREELLEIARQRILDNPDQYHPLIYGEKEVGGTSVLYLSPVPFEELGFRNSLPMKGMPNYTWEALSKIPSVVVVGGVMLSGFYWLTNRKNEIAKEEMMTKENQKHGGQQ